MNDKQCYPELSEEGKIEAQKLIDAFKDKLKIEADKVIESLYCDVTYYIESDSWANFRTAIMDGFRGYKETDKYPYDFKAIRDKIYKEHKEEIIRDLNQDLLAEVDTLKKQVESLSDLRNFIR